jgi:putative endonuclease
MNGRFLYVYVLRSLKDGEFYTGFSSDLKARLATHEAGQVPSTKERRPLELVYYEACRSQADATRREKYLKSAWGKRYLKNRLKDYLTG